MPALALDTDPVVSAHGVETIGTTDEHQVIVSGNQHFDEVVALVLKPGNTDRHFERLASLSPSQCEGIWNIRCEVTDFEYAPCVFP